MVQFPFLCVDSFLANGLTLTKLENCMGCIYPVDT